MQIFFRKEYGPMKDGPLYRSISRPEFTVCAAGLEWAIGYQTDDTRPSIGDEVVIEVTGHKIGIESCLAGDGMETHL